MPYDEKMLENDWLRWVCPDCGATLRSKYQSQLNWNIEQHKLSHKIRKNQK
jgi:hypothetical protein